MCVTEDHLKLKKNNTKNKKNKKKKKKRSFCKMDATPMCMYQLKNKFNTTQQGRVK